MVNWPKITIITPSYNQGEYLEDTIRSILNQGYPNLEYFIMDGGSSDSSVEIIERYAPFLTYWESGPDQGQADAIYRGFQKSTGDILGWVNSDDFLLAGCLEKVGRYFAAHSEDECVVGGSIIIGPDGRPLRDLLGLPQCTAGNRVTFHQLLFFGCPFYQPASFWRRRAFLETGGFDAAMRFSFDYDMFLRLAQRRPYGHIKDVLAYFRVHPDSKSSTISNVKAADDELLWQKYGRYQRSALYRELVYQIYHNLDRARRLELKIKLLLRGSTADTKWMSSAAFKEVEV